LIRINGTALGGATVFMSEMDPLTSLLLTDLYELTMYEAYFEAA
jgi:nicotinic acid phosphoribosyltransferase